MNATDRLTSDLPSPLYDALDGVIDALDHVIPVFENRQLHQGVNTRYCLSFASCLSSQAQDIASTTQNTRRKQIIPTTPKLSILKEKALKAAGEIDSLQRQEWASENADASSRRFLVGVSKEHIEGLLNAITRLESNWGSFHIWIKQPKRAFCESLIRAWKKDELDSEEFLVWFCKHQLGLLGPELYSYVAQVLLGMHVSRGEIVLPGDLQDLAHLNDHEIYGAILRKARSRKLAEKKAPLYTTSGRLEPVATAGELSPMFPATEPTLQLNPMQFAFLRENLRVAGRRAGLTKEQANFLARMALDGAKQEDNPAAWRAIRDRKRASVLAEVQKILASVRREPLAKLGKAVELKQNGLILVF